MSYLGSWKIDDLLTFTVVTQVFTTGVATDADAAPAYRVYENETTAPILTGTMALLDSANTAGLYSEQITLSAANGFEKGKCYNIHIAATVSSVAGAVVRNFQVEAEVAVNTVGTVALASINAEVVDTLATDTYAEPGQGTPVATTSLSNKIGFIYKAWRNKVTQTEDTYTLFGDDASTADQTSNTTDDGTTFTKGEVTTGV